MIPIHLRDGIKSSGNLIRQTFTIRANLPSAKKKKVRIRPVSPRIRYVTNLEELSLYRGGGWRNKRT